MAIYEFKCDDCQQVSEIWMKMSDPAPTACPRCQSPKLHKIMSNTAFALKGSGWYSTDYKKSSSSSSSATSTSESKPAGCASGACGHKSH